MNLNFVNGKFLRYFAWITFCGKIKIREICKIGSTRILAHLSCSRELSWSNWSCATAYGSSFWLYRSLTINYLNINFPIVVNLIGLINIKNKKDMSPSTQLSKSYLSLFFQAQLWPFNLSLCLGEICTRYYMLDSRTLQNTFTTPRNSVLRSL